MFAIIEWKIILIINETHKLKRQCQSQDTVGIFYGYNLINNYNSMSTFKSLVFSGPPGTWKYILYGI